MTPANRPEVKELFNAALELEPQDRGSFVNKSCAADGDPSAEVLTLLSSPETAGTLIEAPALIDMGLVSQQKDLNPSDFIGTRIGPYKIVREIGHGGMGTVFLA